MYQFQKYKKWEVRYYHKACAERNASVMSGLHLPKKRSTSSKTTSTDSSVTGAASSVSGKRKLEELKTTTAAAVASTPENKIEMQMMNQMDQQRKTELILLHRGQLREILRKIRLSFASRLNVAPYMIFHDTTLNSMVELMPSNKKELLKVKGIGPKKVDNFGSSLLTAIARYKAMVKAAPTPAPTQAPTPAVTKTNSSNYHTKHTYSSPPKKVQKISNDVPSSHIGANDDIVFEKELSIEDIVEQRFKEAKEKGNLITL